MYKRMHRSKIAYATGNLWTMAKICREERVRLDTLDRDCPGCRECRPDKYKETQPCGPAEAAMIVAGDCTTRYYRAIPDESVRLRCHLDPP